MFSHTIQSVEGSVSATTTSPAALQQHSVPVPSAHSKYLLLVSGLHIGNPLPVTASSVPTAGTNVLAYVVAALWQRCFIVAVCFSINQKCCTFISYVIVSTTAAGAGQASELSAQLLIDFVAGRLGGQQADIDIASRIARYYMCSLIC